MEDNFYLDDFELSLKEQANQFKMIPSKKVWHGIYNDMHPGRRWPSVTVALILITSIVFVGYINTHSDGKSIASTLEAPLNNNEASQFRPSAERSQSETFASHKSGSDVGDLKTSKKEIASISLGDTKNVPGIVVDKKNISSQKKDANVIISVSEIAGNTKMPVVLKDAQVYEAKQVSRSSISLNPEAAGIKNAVELKNDISNNSIISKELKPSIPEEEISKTVNSETNIPGDIFLANANSNNTSSAIKVNEVDANSSDNKSITSSENIITKVRNNIYKTTWVYYGGVSLNTVFFSGNNLNENINQNSFSLPQVMRKDNRTIHSPAIGFEVGVQMNYLIAKRLELTAGAHFTRSGYNITSNEVHPTLTSLILKDKSTGAIYSRNFVTHYGDGTGQSTMTLHNYNFQASIPLGVQYELGGNSKIQFSLGANIEPSFVLKSNAYILSTDGRNYMNIPDLNRKWNLNSNFAPFITFRAYKFKWNVGPNIRYQWLSSYMDDYTIKEHLFNYGIRIGVSK